jgi:hypothetical protein
MLRDGNFFIRAHEHVVMDLTVVTFAPMWRCHSLVGLHYVIVSVSPPAPMLHQGCDQSRQSLAWRGI